MKSWIVMENAGSASFYLQKNRRLRAEFFEEMRCPDDGAQDDGLLAHKVAARLREGLEAGRYEELVLAGSPHFLARLHEVADPHVLAAVHFELPKGNSALKPQELVQRIEAGMK
jgi:hypothetical protein